MRLPLIFLALGIQVCIVHPLLVRKDVDSLTTAEVLALQEALKEVQEDTGPTGYQAIAAYHGYPGDLCAHDGHKMACCIHGMPTFPQWHRLFTTQMEQALRQKGLGIGVPYWDWTQTVSALPTLVRDPIYINSAGGKALKNYWHKGVIKDAGTTDRAIDDRLFEQPETGHYTNAMEKVLLALEQEDYCKFEIQFEVAHNDIHYLVGGRYGKSMSSLEYTSYDPIFFLHHSNVDRIFAIWQALQKKRGLPWDHSNCGLEMFRTPLEPFGRDSNPFEVTKSHSKGADAFDYQNLGYQYHDLTLNGMSVDDLYTLLNERKTHERAFASFRLYGFGGSANVRVQVCNRDDDEHSPDRCHFAGDVSVLGGPTEMPWAFHQPYLFDITDTFHKHGIDFHQNFYIKTELYAVNGSALPSDALVSGTGVHQPPAGYLDPKPAPVDRTGLAVRKNLDRLTDEEVDSLRKAMARLQSDKSVDGYDAIAEYHGLPARCPRPDAAERVACCVHGMPTFPHWHRLYMVQLEDALVDRGSTIGLPYWDWTKPLIGLPDLISNKMYKDPQTGANTDNPFHHGSVAFEGHVTDRDPDSRLFEDPSYGDHTALFDGMLLALEQEDFCDFEVQFEVTHNNLHAWVGGSAKYSMSSLHYTAFDPVFYLHHSNVDRLWAMWQALQQYRGKPYKAHCATTYTYYPLKPFAFKSPLNNNEKTQKHAVPTNVYDYESELGYSFDSLEFGGMGIQELDHYIQERKATDRVFVGFLLEGFQKSANVDFFIERSGQDKFKAGTIAVLGGSAEMKWRFDRVYKHEITESLTTLGLTKDSDFSISVTLTDVDGTELDASVLHDPTIIFEPSHAAEDRPTDFRVVRKNADRLTETETDSLVHALKKLQEDTGAGGFAQMGAFHGLPNWCQVGDEKVACCAHGMAVFPHWHRLLVVQFEAGLHKYGYKGGVPYWDWSSPMDSLPTLANAATYTHPEDGSSIPNPFYSFDVVEGGVSHTTSRAPRQELFENPGFGKHTKVAKQVMLAFEQEDFCSFETQFEIAHNFIHAYVGGKDEYSMASLRYTAFDPIFYLHHSNTDRIWAMWQALQKYRGKPYNRANCALDSMRAHLKPFAMPSSVNPYPITRDNSIPFGAFDYKSNFHYSYDNLEFNGLSIPQLSRELESRKSLYRVFAGFMLHGIKDTVLVKFYICLSNGDCSNYAGEFLFLGDPAEMPWTYNHLYKYEITDVLDSLHLHHEDRYSIKYEVYDLNNQNTGTQPYPEPTILHEPSSGAGVDHEYEEVVTTASHIRKDINNLNPGEIESLRAAFGQIRNDGTYAKIAQAHGKPGLCNGKGCCVHGMATFPHWHRLYEVQVENALLEHGSAVAVPYWDWTEPIKSLPHLLSDPTFFNSRSHEFDVNPFFSGDIPGENSDTSRDPQPRLFNNDYFYDNMLLAFEQTSFCDFEIQMELVHNALHSWIGGRAHYSLSSLDYTAFDPAFFIHHANVDRLWAIWQELQRYRKLPYNKADCSINLMRKPLYPFAGDENKDTLTKKNSHPQDVFDYRNNLHYKYDNLEFHHMSIPELEATLDARKSRDRVFAGFLLHNIGTSADVEIYICVPKGDGYKDCNNYAGVFSVLGGEVEMPFVFDRLYKYDITPTIHSLGLNPDASDFDLKVAIHGVNGAILSSDALPRPTILLQPGRGAAAPHHGGSDVTVRKEINTLTPLEVDSLMKAMRRLQEDSSPNGYQGIASFHAVPPLCPSPAAANRFACCVHGMATFPQWHRLHVVQMEQALKDHGATVGLPYWDWTRPMTSLPDFFNDGQYTDARTGVTFDNPFHHADINFEGAGVHTRRSPNEQRLFEDPSLGYNTWLFENVILALEQDNYCDFEVQFEVMHNAIHAWIGGGELRSMGHLHYASYDPIFYIHHSTTDRIFAMWQALQNHRGLDGEHPNCALEVMKEKLKPFSFGKPYNLNPVTAEYSKPGDTFDFKNHFHYDFDKLEIGGMSAAQLDTFIQERKERDRVFAGFLLAGFKMSATVKFQVCKEDGTCQAGGSFEVLGGTLEMPWRFDRLYKYEITDVLDKMDIRYDDPFHFEWTVTPTMPGDTIDSNPISEPSVIFVPAIVDHNEDKFAHNQVRRNINELDEADVRSLSSALTDLMADEDKDGFQAIARFHGMPVQCGDVACCHHGMPTFPHWHRLITVQFEMALQRHGSSSGLPYWDWTEKMDALPHLLTEPEYYDAWTDKVVPNPFARGYIESEDTYTVRDVRNEFKLFDNAPDAKHSILFNSVMYALEQEDFCDFEVQFEVIHNAIHFLIGGFQTYALSSLHYSSYDPLFYIHHANVDRIWAVWQELQKARGMPHNSANCALNLMSEPMHPFDMGININKVTKRHATPSTVFDFEDFGYTYDSFKIGGLSLSEIQEEIDNRRNHDRVFAGFLLSGIKTSALVHFHLCKSDDDCIKAGEFGVLGGEFEMPWAFDRLYKYEITSAVKEAGLNPNDVFNAEAPFHLKLEITKVDGTQIPSSELHKPTIIYEPAHGHESSVGVASHAGRGVRKNVNTLTPSEIDNLKDAMRAVQADKGVNGYQSIAAYHGLPAQCGDYACCLHGMPTFPHWHRLYVKQMEDALAAHGAEVGMPYWDWTAAFTKLPALVTDPNDNPWVHAHIEYLNEVTTRAPRPQLFKDPEHNEGSFFYRQMLLAFEQTDYCDFEVQFEMTHNAIHSWTGSASPYGLSSLDFTSYDPLFYVHHSNTDRLWAMWQALQRFRGKPYNTAYCALEQLKKPIRPFSDASNPNPVTRAHARALRSFNYEALNYQYDTLSFNGMSIPELDDLVHERQEKDRIFAAFSLEGIKKTCDVKFDVCKSDGECKFAGTFAILGSEYEMHWRYDRAFRYDITDTMEELHLKPESEFTIKLHLVQADGTELSSDLVDSPEVIFVPGSATHEHHTVHEDHRDVLLRKNINSLSLEEARSLRDALYKLQNDQTENGFEHIAGFHGEPNVCPEDSESKYACCAHGMPIFPHWHRLLTVQFERGLVDNGALIGLPYWDWTVPSKALPSLFAEESNNPFYKYHIGFANTDTEGDVQDFLFNQPSFYGKYNYLYYLALTTLEEDNYCDFEVQFEVLHNAMHCFIGGTGAHSMNTLDYSAFDPFFIIHHSSIDRIWIIWNELQKLRHKSFSYAECTKHHLDRPLHPFNYASVNHNELTRTHSMPNQAADQSAFGYWYDNLDMNHHTVAELAEEINSLRNSERVFAGFVLHGFGASATRKVFVNDHYAGTFNVLGDRKEMPWAYERLFKYDITEVLRENNLNAGHNDITFRCEVTALDGTTALDPNTLSDPVLVLRPARVNYDVIIFQMAPTNHNPPAKVIVKKGTKLQYHPHAAIVQMGLSDAVAELGSYTSWSKCIVPPFGYRRYQFNTVYSLSPGNYYFSAPTVEMCKQNRKLILAVEEE
uniref:Hemocyanin isoform 1 n=1 Tax=Nucula nucleus TaxID=47129 RepID=J3JRX6_9BIVA|nr:hemocyanin isoform 1 [Nucula nucleus]